MSIVSVYCKPLLRLFIVGVYCKHLLCFIVFSVQNVARSLVLLRFRLHMLFVEYVLLCFCSHMCRKHYKTNQKSVFCISARQTLCFTVAIVWQCLFPCLIVSNPLFYGVLKKCLCDRRLADDHFASRFVCVSVYSPL